MARELEALEPFGAGNPRPVFVTRNLRLLVGADCNKGPAFEVRLAGPQNRPLEAVWWNCIETPGQTPELNGSIELAYTLETRAWNGDYRMQLNVLDLNALRELTPSKRCKITNKLALGLRAKVPVIARIVAFALLASGIAVVGVSYYKLRNVDKFKAKSEKPELSKEVTGVVEGYEQRVTKNDRLYLLVKASRDVTFSDGHHELENVSMAVYPPEGETPDQISAARAIYQPDTNVLSFIGNVKIETKEKLKVNTDALSFDQNSGVAQTDSPVAFERENVSGTSTGAVVEQKAKRLELKNNVQLTIAPETRPLQIVTRARPVTIKAAHGTFDQQSMY